MPEVTIVYCVMSRASHRWVSRRGSKRQLAERFEQAIDMAAMRQAWQELMITSHNGAKPRPILLRGCRGRRRTRGQSA